jgi:hypothetical protein
MSLPCALSRNCEHHLSLILPLPARHRVLRPCRNGRRVSSLQISIRIGRAQDSAAIPNIKVMIRSDEKIVALLNCAEVHGAPNSSTLFSKGFVQAAIVERAPSAEERPIIYSLSSNLVCVLNEKVFQVYEDMLVTETKCCCFNKQRGQDFRTGSLAHEHSVISQSLSETSMLSNHDVVVKVQVIKKKIDSLRAMADPSDHKSFPKI